MTSFDIIKGMLKLYCTDNIKDRKDMLGYAIYELGGRRLHQKQVDSCIDTIFGISLAGKMLMAQTDYDE